MWGLRRSISSSAQRMRGDASRAGDRYGIVKFGSRMDVIVPPHVAFTAQIGDRVTAGETVIGHFGEAPPAAATVAAQAAAPSAAPAPAAPTR